VLRVANRIGIAEGDDPVAVEAQLCERLPDSMWTLASDVQILHGRRVCRPTNPLCGECPVADECAYYAVLQRESRGARPKQRSVAPAAAAKTKTGAGGKTKTTHKPKASTKRR
jgi:hypothetical protein